MPSHGYVARPVPAASAAAGWLGTDQRLDLAFLIDAEHQRAIRRVELEVDDVADLLDEQGNVSLRRGCSGNARQMRCIVEIDTPVALAIVGTLKNGIHTNGLAAAGPKAFSVFSGRTGPEPQNKWGIFGSRVSSGVTCP